MSTTPTNSKAILQSLANMGSLILPLKASNPNLYVALQSLTKAVNYIIPIVQPPPAPPFWGRFYIGALTTGVVAFPFQIKMPQDPNWKYSNASLYQIVVTSNTPVSAADIKIDIQVVQLHGTATARSIFKSGLGIDLPAGLATANVNVFAFNNFQDGDLLVFNVTQTDSGDDAVEGVEIILEGTYSIAQITQ